MKYKRAIPDMDISFGKYVLNKTVGLTKPTGKIAANIIVGAAVSAAFLAAGWMATVGVWYYGFYVGSALHFLDLSKIHNTDYQYSVGPIPWLIGVGTVVVPYLIYKIGSHFTKL